MSMRHFLLELRDSARSLRRDRGFSLTVILTLAITIGATTAAFSIVNGILLKPLAYPQPERLVMLLTSDWPSDIRRGCERGSPDVSS